MAERDGAEELEHRPRARYHLRALLALSLLPLAAIPGCSREKPVPLQTTSGPIALENLDAQLVEEERALKQQATADRILHLIVLHSTRSELLGAVEDLEAAAALGERAVREFPSAGYAHFARARARILAHRFDEAELDLQEAQRLGVPQTKLDDARATIHAASGRFEDALALLDRVGERDALHLARRARLHSELGQIARAEELFSRAEREYSEVSPFALAWVYGEHGLAVERAGDSARAKILYEEALKRVPGLLVPSLALARMERSPARLEPLKSRYNPEVTLARAELSEGEARANLLAEADVQYQKLFEQHPFAYAEHAAQFWLRAGEQPLRALLAAETNLSARETRTALELALLAALAARNNEASCRLSHRAKAKGGEIARALAPLIATGQDNCPTSR